ncbi:recombinase family protein, partial [Salmonella enterica]|nr:recombinase family protein [Salmonella enterica]
MASENDKNHRVRVAQYLRMSTDHQQYSLHNQSEYIKDYAEKNNMEIAYTYDDAGKSGVSIVGRHSLQQLLSDVEQKKIDIQAVLFYDVSRFGRFQNSDEAAYYSFLFERNGVDLIYCSEPIPTKDFPLESSVILNIKRSSAAYHSRNLSEKVFIGQVNLIKLGYHQGGMAGYGLRRLLVDENGIAKEILSFRKRKSIQTDRVILIPGPKNEIKIVNRIYDLFIDNNVPEFIIAERLNEQNIPAENGTLWTRAKIHQILANEKYIGNNIYNKTSSKLKSRLVKNPKHEWVRCDKAYKPIISKKKYNKAQEIIQLRS